VLHSGSMRENGHKLEQGRFIVVVRKKCFPLEDGQAVEQVPGETAGSFLGVFQDLTVKEQLKSKIDPT